MAPRRLTKLTSEAGDAKPLVKSEFPTAVSPLDKDGEPLLVSALLLSLMDIASLSSAGSLSSLSGEASLSSLSIKLLSTNSVVEVWLSLKVKLLLLWSISIAEVLLVSEKVLEVELVCVVVIVLVIELLVELVVESDFVSLLVWLVVVAVDVWVSVELVILLVKVHDCDMTDVEVVEVASLCHKQIHKKIGKKRHWVTACRDFLSH